MRQTRWFSAIVLASFLLSVRAPAQQPIRVVRHSPVDTARAGDVITVSFDRPVAGSVERSARPERFVRIDPPIHAKVEWRDLVSLRVIPDEPLAPGRRFRITVDTTFTALDGGRLGAPYQFSILTSGPRYLGSIPPLGVPGPAVLDPPGRLTLVYSAAIDSARFASTVRAELDSAPGCDRRVVRYAVTQRAVVDTDGYDIRAIGGYDNEPERHFRHVITLTPRTAMPESCLGVIVIPSLDPNDRAEIHYPIATAEPFTVAELWCQATDCAASRSLTLVLTGPVYRDSVLRRIHLDPAIPFTIPESDSPSNQWSLQLAITPRTTYRVTVDSTLRDVFGRPLRTPTTVGVHVGDRRSAIGHQLGFFTVSRHHPVLRVTHVNIDSARLAFVPIPEAMRTSVLFALRDQDSVARMISRLRDSVKVDVALRAPFNEERITEIPIPRVVLERFPGALIAIRARSTRSSHPPLDLAERERRKINGIEPIEIIASETELTNRVALVQVTDLAVHARVSNEPGAVFVTDINTGTPVGGASVTVRDTDGREMSTGTTDSSGVGRLRATPGWRPLRARHDEWWYVMTGRYWDANRARLIDVRLRDDRSVVCITPELYADPNESATTPEQADIPTRLVRALAYTDRAIYKPGEPVYLGVIARHGWQGELKPLAEHDSLRIRVDDGSSEGDVVRDTVIRVDRFGTAADSFTLSTGSALGYYTARVDVMTPGGWRQRASAEFRVAEYRAPQFRASVLVDSGARFLGDSIRARATGTYYFGASMAGAAVHWSTQTEDAGSVDIPRLPEGFVVARRYREGWGQAEAGGQEFGTDTLDARGTVRLTMPTARGTLIGPARVTTYIAVEDVDRQTAGATESTILHSSSFYVAVRDSGGGWYWRQGRPRTLDVLAVTPTGRRVAGVRMGLTIIRRYASWSASANTEETWRWVADTVGRDSVVSADSIVHMAFTPARDGSYEVALTSRDEQGRPVATSLGAYVIPPQWFGAWGLDPAALAIRLARDTVAPGDSARLSVVSPFPRAEAWVTVEREGILAQLRRTVPLGETTFRIPVDARFIPGAQVSVLLVNAAPAWKTDSTHRRIRSASLPLSVDRSSKAITVQLQTNASRYAPGDSARLTVRLRDHGGRPLAGKVAVWAVDESVLALTDSTRLSPLDSMYADPWSRLFFASTAPTLSALGRFLTPHGWVRRREDFFGGIAANSVVTTGTGGAKTVEVVPRTDFRTTAFYLASLEADDGGFATAVVKLPENLTTYRVISIAVDRGDRFGAAETSFTITKPLIARAALPRFVRTGDTFTAGAVVTNQTGAPLSATVTASAHALVLETDRPIDRLLPDGASSEARFAWKATAAPGDMASVRFVVNGGPIGDAVETPVIVRAPYTPRFHAMAGVTRGSATVRLMLPSGIDPVRSRLTLRVGTTPVTTIRAAYDQLVVYPFLCSEQLASRGRATIAMLRLSRAGLLDSATGPRPPVLRDELQWIVDELTRRQTPDGAIGYWSGTSWSTGPLSMYAALVLLDARDLGIAVRPVVLERVADYLKESLEESPAPPDSVYGTAAERRARTASRLGSRLAALHYLRRLGQPDEVRENDLLNFASQMVWEDRVWLAELVARRGDRSQAGRMLTGVWRDVEIAGTRVDIPDSLLSGTVGFRSHVRPVARLLRATLAIDRDHPKLPWLIERIVQQGVATRDRLWNTQDYAAAADALVEVALWQRTSGAGATVTVRSALRDANAPVLLRKVVSQTSDTSVSLGGLVEHEGEWTVLPLQISGGDARVFYVLTVEEVPLAPPTTPDAKGIIVERWYERFDDGRPVSEVAEGELVRARLRITVPSDREFVAIADPLPAGLEAVDLSLQTSRTIGPFESAESEAAEQAGDRANRESGGYYGRWYGGWWSPWEHEEIRDDRVTYFARILWKGTYTASYVARATTAGTFIRPPAHAEEMYDPSLGGRSDGGVFRVIPR